MNARIRRRPVEPDGERRRQSPSGAIFACILAAATMTSGCAGVADRNGTGPDSGGASAKGPAATEPGRAAEVNAEVPAETTARMTVQVTVEGVEGALARNVRAHLSLAKEACDAPRWRVERLLERAADEARDGLRALGYYAPESVTVTLGEGKGEGDGCPHATVSVSPGEPVLVGIVDMRLEGAGSEDEAFAAHLDTLRLPTGEVLDHGAYEEARRAIERYAAEHGYLEGEFVTRRFTVDVTARSARVELVYRPGRRFWFGALDIEPTALDASLVERLAAWPEGAPYDADRLVEVSQQLSQSGYFERVDVNPRIDRTEDDTIPVEVSLTPRKRHAFTAGAGITTDAGPRLRLGYEDRRTTADGHRWSARSAASLIRRSLDAEYRIPLADPRTEWLSFDAGVVDERTETSRTNEARLGVSQTKSRWSDWIETRFVSLTYDDYSVGKTRGIARLLTPGVSLATTRHDDRLRPSDGHRLYGEVRGSHEAAGSDVSFLRLSGSAGWVQAVPGGGRLLARAELGAMTVDGFDALPPSQRFFAGGDSSVRGYEFASLGPVDADGTVVGGRMLAVGSIEYEHPIRDRWSGAVFTDAGNAFDTGYRNDGLKVGAGLGVRWQSPIGAVRLDVARPLDATQRFRLHLRLGPDL